ERERRVPVETLRQAAEAGLCGLLIPCEQGGAGLSTVGVARTMEELAAADMAFAFALVVHNNIIGAIVRGGSPALEQRYLDEMRHGRRFGAFLLTEPDVGSDAAAITTRARRDGEEWVIDGEKAWV